jgi:ElaB/YqjD/DUF883 family membrane-anchored ribosome-binding protein
MAEVWRANAETPESPNNDVNPLEESATAACTTEEMPALPTTTTPASNPAWNRSAEAVGRGVGTAVSEVRRLPRRLDNLKYRIHLVGKNAEQSVHEARSSAEAAAAELRDAAELGLLELADKAALYTSEIGSRASHRIEDLRREAWWKLEAVRAIVRHRASHVRRWKPQRPLQVIVVSASAAFALGVLLRIWGSNRD